MNKERKSRLEAEVRAGLALMAGIVVLLTILLTIASAK